MSKEKKAKQEVLTLDTVVRDKLTDRFVKVNTQVFRNAKRDSWKLAREAFAITSCKDFKKGFKNQSDFAKAVGYSEGAISKLVTSEAMNTAYSLESEYDLTTGQAQELIPIYKLDKETADERVDQKPFLELFLESHKDDFIGMTTKDLRALVTSEMSLLTGATNSEEAESADDEVDAQDLAPDTVNEPVEDAVIKSSQEVLSEIIGVVQQAEETEVQDSAGNWHTDTLICVYSAIRTILAGEELI